MAGDKRIYNLSDPGVDPLIDDYLAYDRPGFLEAARISFTRLVSFVSARVVKQVFTKGAANPDNAAGINGDFYVKIPADNSNLSLYQKAGSVWQQVFDLPIGTGGGTSGVPSRMMGGDEGVNVSVPPGAAQDYIPHDCTGSECVSSILCDDGTVKKSLSFTQEGPFVYGNFPEGDYALYIVIQGYPAGLPEADPPSNGVVQSGPNTFAFTPSDIPITDPA